MKGKVKFFDNIKEFGFIVSDDGQEYFVHKSGIKEGNTIGKEDSVQFDVEEGDKGKKAVNVELKE